MQTLSSTLIAAMLDRDREPIVRLRVDWNRNGTYTDTYSTTTGAAENPGGAPLPGQSVNLPLDDISKDVVHVRLSRELSTDIPQAAKLFAGHAAAEATVTLKRRTPYLLAEQHTAWWYSALNTASPLFALDRKGAPAILEVGLLTDAGPEYVRVLTGTVRSLDVSRNGQTATLRLGDRAETMRRQVQLPPIIADGASTATVLRPGLNTTYLADWVARKCGYYASPPQRSGCKFMATLHGSGWPEVGTIEEHHGHFGSKFAYSPTPTFPTAARWVQAINHNGNSGQAARYFLGGSGVISTNNTRTCYLGGWAKLNSTAVDQPLAIIFDDFATSAPYFTLWFQGSTGQLKLNFNRAGTDNVNRTATGPTISPGTSAWHYYAAHVSFTSTGVTVNFRYDSTTTGPVTVATASVTNALDCQRIQLGRGLAGAFSDSYLDALLEDWQATTEATVSTWDNGFVPSAEIRVSAAIDNRLVATPDVAEEGWPLLQELAKAEFATTGFTELGLFYWWPRDRWTTAPYTTSQATLTPKRHLHELATTEAIDQVRNRIVIRARVPSVTGFQIVWKLATVTSISAGSSRVIIASLQEPAANVDPTVIYGTTLGQSRYLAADRADGQGIQVTNLTFLVTQLSPTAVRIEVGNPNAFRVWLVGDENASATYAGKPYLWLSAQKVQFGADVEGATGDTRVEASSSTSIARFDEQLLELDDSDLRQDDDDLQLLADHLRDDLAFAKAVVPDVAIVANLALQLADRVTLADPDGLAFTADFHLAKADLTVDPGEGMHQLVSFRGA